MAIDKITSASITTDAVGPTQLNEASNYAFTGTVTGAGGVNTPYFLAFANANASISHATYTKVEIDTEVVDTDSKFETSNYRFTPTVAGYYIIGGFVRFDSATSTEDCMIGIHKNGSVYYKHVEGKSNVTTKHINQVVYLDSNDYVELYCYQNSGSSQNINGAGSMDSVSATFYGYKLIS